MTKIALIGNGYLGRAYEKVFPEAVIYDEPKELFKQSRVEWEFGIKSGRTAVNACDLAIVAVPTDPLEDGSLDMSIIEEVVDWCEADTILLKSALMPGTVDRLVEKTGKNIAVSVEFIGMGKYYQPPHKYPDPEDPRKHDMLIVGGAEPGRSRAAEILWSKMSPDTKIHLLTAREAEAVKLLENAWGAFKVTWANCMFSLITKAGGNFIDAHQAWSSDGRVDAMHTRVISTSRGWKSHCYDKDVDALRAYADSIGAGDMAELVSTVIKINEGHLSEGNI